MGPQKRDDQREKKRRPGILQPNEDIGKNRPKADPFVPNTQQRHGRPQRGDYPVGVVGVGQWIAQVLLWAVTAGLTGLAILLFRHGGRISKLERDQAVTEALNKQRDATIKEIRDDVKTVVREVTTGLRMPPKE